MAGLFVGDNIAVDLTFTHAEGDIDLELLDPTGTVAASSATTTDDESLTHTATAAGVWTIRVTLSSDSGSQTGNSYGLETEIF